MKEEALTGGGLGGHGLPAEKPAEVIVAGETSRTGERKAGSVEVSQAGEGLNVKMFQMQQELPSKA
ncbi:hypothetical protein FACS1894181_16100 [Bacteroidia bacterium]|nr:hypothetical protein FACS1894181_16100 [Bacteroidia bacterium]